MADLVTVSLSLIDFPNVMKKAIKDNDKELLRCLLPIKDKVNFEEIFRPIFNTQGINIKLDMFKILIEEFGLSPEFDTGILLRVVSMAADDNLDIIKYFVEEKKVNINLGLTWFNPINNACRNGNMKIIKYLIEHGADPKLVDLSVCNILCKDYIKSLIDDKVQIVDVVPKYYFGIKVSEKLQWTFPKLEEKIKDNEYYYVFSLEGSQTKETMLSMFSILEQLKSDIVPEFHLL